MISEYNICGKLEHGIDVLGSPTIGSMHSVNKIHDKIKPIDITQYRASKPYTYPEKEGEVFTGWYMDKDYEEQVDNEFVTEGKFYPMYADADTMIPVLKTKVNGTLYQYMVISSLPCHNVLEKGFYINGTKRKVTQMATQINAFDETIHRTDFNESSVYLYSISLMNTQPLVIEAVPYIVTLDGTEVKGTYRRW